MEITSTIYCNHNFSVCFLPDQIRDMDFLCEHVYWVHYYGKIR